MSGISNTQNNHNSNEECQFFKFRDENIEKLRKRQELNLEYQKFKLEDEEKFRNRFASKKRNKSEQTNEVTTNKTLPTTSEYPGDNIKILLERLDSLQKDVDKLKQHQAHSITGSNSSMDTSCLMQDEGNQKNKAEEIKNSNIVEKAVKHLNELENIIMTLNITESHETADTDAQSSSSPECLNDDIGSKPHFLILSGKPESQERSKQMKQEEYANELKKQIEDKQRLKKMERQKEREEDRLNFAETHEFNTLGQRIRDKDEESVDQKPTLSDTKHSRYARGGNGIFGDPLTETQKQANAIYRAELMSQIEEKRQREAKRIQEEKEIENKEKEYESMNASAPGTPKGHNKEHSDEVAETITAPRSPQEASNKHNVCVQVALERKYQQNKPKAKKVVRTSNQSKKIKDSPKLADLLAQVTQLKVELAAEERRIQQSRSENEDGIQVYDPRLINSGYSKTDWSANPSFTRPIRVHRVIAAPAYSIEVRKSKQDFEEPVFLSSSSTFLPHGEEIIERSPSVDSLNLDEINRRMERRFEQLRIHEDLYKNEEPIIRKFMAEEEARIIADYECY